MSENTVKTFTNTEFGSVRTLIIHNEPWFVGKDVADILGYKRTSDVIRKHIDRDDKGVAKMETPGGTQDTTIINESGLYSLILSSKLPKAKQFKRWVTSEVLPAIRKTGGYVSNEDLFINTYLPFADDNTKMLFRTTLSTINQLNHKIEKDKPLVEFAEHVSASEDCISMNDMAKLAAKNGIRIGRNKLFALLRDKKILQKNNIPYQRYIDAQPWFQVKESVYDTATMTRICMTTMVTTLGQKGILKMLRDQ